MTEERKQQLLKSAVNYLKWTIQNEQEFAAALRHGLHMTDAEQAELGCAGWEPSPQAASQGKSEGAPRLRELLSARWEDVHLMHDEIENDPSTIVELSSGTLTEAGKQAWGDVLAARVLRIYTGFYGLQMELSGVKAGRLDEFSAMLAGYCPCDDYARWVTQEDPNQAQTLSN